MIEPARVVCIGDGDGTAAAVAAALDGEVGVVRADDPVDGSKRLQDEPVECVVVGLPLPDRSLERLVGTVGAVAPAVPVLLVGDPSDPAAALDVLEGPTVDYLGDTPDRAAARVRRILDERRTDEALADHERLKAVFRDVIDAVVDADSRDAIERATYDRLIAVDRYQFVWVGEYDAAADELRLSEPFDGRVPPSELDAIADGGGDALADAVSSGEVTVVRGGAATRSAARAPAPGSTPGNRSGSERALATAVVPLTDGDTVRGTVVLSSDRPDAFDRSERDLLGVLGRTVAHAMGTVEGHDASEPDDFREFAATLAHELRSPLGVASTYLEVAREDDDPAALDRAETALDEMEATIEGLLSVAGGGTVEETSVGELEADARTAWETVAADDAELVVEDSTAFEADHRLVTRLLADLFHNAVTHGGDEVTVRVGTLPDGFYVEDDGPGIPPEERDRVFEWGHSTDDGAGIGLSIVGGIVDRHGWSIEATSGGSGGARFEITGV